MFGIGLPEMILIMALALIVVGPDKLPDLARSLAKGLVELKKTAEGLKKSFAEEGNPLDEIKPDLEEAAKSLKQNLLDTPPYKRNTPNQSAGVNPPADNAAAAYEELMKTTGTTPEPPPAENTKEDINKAAPTPEDDQDTVFTPVKDDSAANEPEQHKDQQPDSHAPHGN
jgi:sec-independent protein translocase protein TatB